MNYDYDILIFYWIACKLKDIYSIVVLWDVLIEFAGVAYHKFILIDSKTGKLKRLLIH